MEETHTNCCLQTASSTCVLRCVGMVEFGDHTDWRWGGCVLECSTRRVKVSASYLCHALPVMAVGERGHACTPPYTNHQWLPRSYTQPVKGLRSPISSLAPDQFQLFNWQSNNARLCTSRRRQSHPGHCCNPHTCNVHVCVINKGVCTSLPDEQRGVWGLGWADEHIEGTLE